MFGIDSSELLVVAVIALLVVGPKDLPKLLRTVGYWVGRARGMARHFRSGIDTMIRESELEEMEAKWREENARIMRDHPPAAAPASDAPTAPALSPEDQAKAAGPPPETVPAAARNVVVHPPQAQQAAEGER